MTIQKHASRGTFQSDAGRISLILFQAHFPFTVFTDVKHFIQAVVKENTEHRLHAGRKLHLFKTVNGSPEHLALVGGGKFTAEGLSLIKEDNISCTVVTLPVLYAAQFQV